MRAHEQQHDDWLSPTGCVYVWSLCLVWALCVCAYVNESQLDVPHCVSPVVVRHGSMVPNQCKPSKQSLFSELTLSAWLLQKRLYLRRVDTLYIHYRQ